MNGPVRIVRLDTPLDAVSFDSLVRSDGAVSLLVAPLTADSGAAWRALEQAHIYHIASAKDDLPRHLYAEAALLQRCPDLLAVSAYGAGFDTVDVAACTRAGVAVVNQSGSNSSAVAEHTLGLMLGLCKRIAESDRRLRRGEHFTRADMMGFDLMGRTLGVVGIGHAGGRVTQLARAFGMTVLATDPFVPPEDIAHRGADPVPLAELLQRSDVVSLHCPLDAGTRGMIGAAQFAAMKKGALFITTARGGIHDEAALERALRSGQLAGAGLDVWSAEPPPMDHPLLALDNVLATHHTAGVTVDSRRQMATLGAAQVLALAHGARPPRLVNPEVWPLYASRFESMLGRRPAAT
jgi:D-3-phosphoglycerate dehydrogenase